MHKLSGLIVGIALAVAAPLASAASDSPAIGGAETTFQSGPYGINAPTNTSEFWYAGTGGVAPE